MAPRAVVSIDSLPASGRFTVTGGVGCPRTTLAQDFASLFDFPLQIFLVLTTPGPAHFDRLCGSAGPDKRTPKIVLAGQRHPRSRTPSYAIRDPFPARQPQGWKGRPPSIYSEPPGGRIRLGEGAREDTELPASAKNLLEVVFLNPGQHVDTIGPSRIWVVRSPRAPLQAS